MVSPFQKDTINNFHWFVTVLLHLTVYQKSFHIITYFKDCQYSIKWACFKNDLLLLENNELSLYEQA